MSLITKRVSVSPKHSMKEGHYLLMLSLLSGLFFFIGWPVNPFPFLLFFAFVPILAIENYLAVEKPKKAGKKFFFCVYFAFFIWNLGSTWWVYFSTAIGAVFMLIANSFLMTLPILLFRFTKRKAGSSWGYFSFVMYWLAFEYIHINWDLSWPWLTLGNGLSTFPQWIQWYEYTGVFGGSLWIILANLAIFFVIFKSNWITKGIVPVLSIVYILFFILIPITISYLIYFNYEEQGEETEIVVLQPNIDPFTEKFIGTENFIPFEKQLDLFFKLSQEKITPNTSFVVWPETALDVQVLEERYQEYDIMQSVISFRNKNPHISLVTGLTTTHIFPDKASAPPSARYHAQSNVYYGVYNTAFFLNDNNEHEFYHKSKLVPGVEIMPYPQVFGFVSDLLFNLGGTSGGFGRQEDRTVFYNSDGIGVAPSICYESIYGEFMAKFVNNGANFIFIITNDGWWGNSPGYKQHLQYATMRAIESRRSIARSANTGISTFINQKGDILEKTDFWKQDALRGTIKGNDKITFYVQYGDYIGRTATWLSVFIFLSAMVKRKIKR